MNIGDEVRLYNEITGNFMGTYYVFSVDEDGNPVDINTRKGLNGDNIHVPSLTIYRVEGLQVRENYGYLAM